MRKKYFILENIAFWGGITAIIIYGICVQIMILELSRSIVRVFICITFMALLGICYIFFFKHIKKMGFGQLKIDPHIYQTQLNYEIVIEMLSYFFSHIYILNDDTSYIFEKQNGLKLRINILRFDVFSNEILKQRKKIVNRIINKKHKVKNNIAISNAYNLVRVNFIIVKDLDEYCMELMNNNASNLFDRVECVLNVILSESDGRLFIPAHFGLNKMRIYNKTISLLENVLRL